MLITTIEFPLEEARELKKFAANIAATINAAMGAAKNTGDSEAVKLDGTALLYIQRQLAHLDEKFLAKEDETHE